MALPEIIQEKIASILDGISPSDLKKAREFLSSSYKKKNTSDPIFSDSAKTLAYLAVRFPATYAAISYVIREIQRQLPDFCCDTILDLGSGPATATLAAFDLLNLKRATLIEKSPQAISLGKELLQGQEWICQDLSEIDDFPKADLCIASYAFGEVLGLKNVLEKVWESAPKFIVIIEPGTPSGYQTIINAREFFLKKGAHILAPCPHEMACPLKGDNWCHFSVRLERTKLHRFLKEGERGFEDEKFSYLVISNKRAKEEDRILRHPFKGSGFTKLNLCTRDGQNIEKTISRKDKDLYRKAKKAKWGDPFSY